MAKPLNGLQDGISRKLIPWVESGQTNFLVMPCAAPELPADVELQHKPILGPRRRSKNRRPAGQMSVNAALWPEDGLCAKAEPFLLWVLVGRPQLHIGTQLLCCRESTAVYIPSGLPHPDGSRPYIPQGEAGSCSILWIRQCGRGLRCWISHSRDGRNLSSRPGESAYFTQERIVQVFGVLCEELEGRTDSPARRHALMLFLLLLQQELIAGRAFQVVTYSVTREVEEWSGGGQHPVERACAYIQSHLSDPLSIESVARVVHLSRATFARQFREYSGQTFLEYVHKHRMERAQTMLRETDWTVRTISALCGFSSYSSFNNFFSKHSGATPARYREGSRASLFENEMNE